VNFPNKTILSFINLVCVNIKLESKEILENKLLEFGFTNVKSAQIYYYDKDHLGNKINWRELPFCNQRWKK
jgi:hypothetical protein